MIQLSKELDNILKEKNLQNAIVIVKDGIIKVVDSPLFGTVNIIHQNGKPVRYEVVSSTKLT